MMEAVRFFMDTAYVLALLNPRDEHHKEAKRLLPRLRGAGEVWVTEAVLTEVGNALSGLNRKAACGFIDKCYATGNMRVVTVEPKLFRRGLESYRTHEDKEWRLTDCISFVVMRDNGLKEAFTTDRHFEQAGFSALLD